MSPNEICTVLQTAMFAGAREVVRVRLGGGDLGATIKYGQELVTRADANSDGEIVRAYRTGFGEDPELVYDLEESGCAGAGRKRAAADPLDGTNIFAAGGRMYSVQGHYDIDGQVIASVVFQPEYYIPLRVRNKCAGRMLWAVRGEGAFECMTEFTGNKFVASDQRPLRKLDLPKTDVLICCVPFSTKMKPEERAMAQKVHDSGIIGLTTGTGAAGSNIGECITGGQHVYGNFGAGDVLDIAPPQLIAIAAGLTVWGLNRKEPIWTKRKQPVVVAQSPEMAERVLQAAGL